MKFREDKVDEFLDLFQSSMQRIRDFDGVEHLELHRDSKDPTVYYTLSIWKSEDHLEKYRTSNLFKSVWSSTKVLFADKPIAYSLQKEITVNPS